MKMRSVLVVTILAVAIMAVCASCPAAFAAEDKYPSKPILAIIAFNPGGGTDLAARTILRFAEKYIGTSFVVDNRPGGGGAIGWTAIATAPKDGYTIGMINPPSIVFNPITLGDKVKYKLEDFAPIANFVSDPGACIVEASSQFNSLKDIVDFAKAHPDELRIAYSGPGTTEALTIRRLEQANNVKFRKIPFDGTGPMLTALMGDHADIMFANASEVVPQYTAKTIKVLAVGTEKRIDMMPDVPTYRESGFDQLQVAMRGLAAPAGIGDDKIKILADAMEKTFADPEFRKAAAELSLPLDYIGPDDYKKLLQEFDRFYRKEFAEKPW
jgi:tripartite-type tricarboxylate transporter receptor subunit TctC